MEEVFDNKLTLKNEYGADVSINVFDIVDSEEFDKTFILYTIHGGDENTVFASILNEKELEYSLDTIISPEEIDYINKEIKYFTEDDIEESEE
jgi:hypothetical protein